MDSEIFRKGNCNASHIDEVKRFLGRLTFDAYDDRFVCHADDLVRLGQRADPSITDRAAALRHGTEQFKVSFDELREAYRSSAWAKENVLIAVVGGSGDGTSGIRDGADTTLRQEVERFAHIVFASNPDSNVISGWVENHLLPTKFEIRYDGLKPCLHGNDGHSIETVGVPDEDRYT